MSSSPSRWRHRWRISLTHCILYLGRVGGGAVGRGFASALARKRAGATIAAIREVGLHPCRGGTGDGGGGGGPVMIETDAPFMSPDKS
jgi:hypothetical protein